jgi:acyl carrier protein
MAAPGTTDIQAGVIEALKRISRRPIEPRLDNDLIADLGFDSLEVLELVAELEERFGISVPVEDVPATRTVAQAIAHVTRLVGERAPGI